MSPAAWRARLLKVRASGATAESAPMFESAELGHHLDSAKQVPQLREALLVETWFSEYDLTTI